MIPTGVTRIVWAIAPNSEMREAMLGDLTEEYDLRRARDGVPAARRWCWREGIRSLFDTLRHTAPRFPGIFSSLLPGVIWGWAVAVLTAMAAMVFTLPLTRLFTIKTDPTGWWTLLSLAVMLAASVMGGYEAARVGKKAALWSAALLGMVPALAALGSVVAQIVAAQPLRPILFVVGAADLLILPCALLGAILQQSQYRRLEVIPG